jgi:hypothetical protein
MGLGKSRDREGNEEERRVGGRDIMTSLRR